MLRKSSATEPARTPAIRKLDRTCGLAQGLVTPSTAARTHERVLAVFLLGGRYRPDVKLSLHSIELKNFRSVADAHIDFDANGMVLLQGPSGAGKSTINLAIAYAFGFCPIPQAQLQRWGSKEMSVKLEFLLDGELVWVHRGTDFVGMSGPGEYSSIHGAKNVNGRLLTLLKVNADMLGALTYRPQQEPGAFIRKTDAEKKEFLTQILRLDEFERAVETGNLRIKKFESDIELVTNDVGHLTRALADAEAAVMDPPSQDEVEQAELTIAQTKARLTENQLCLQELETLNPEAAEKKRLHDEANKHLDKAIADDERRATEFARTQRQRREIAETYRRIQMKYDQVERQVRDLDAQEETLLGGTCPTCNQNVGDGAAAARVGREKSLLLEQLKKLTLNDEQLQEMARYEAAGTEQFVPSPNIEKLRKIAVRFYSEVQVAQEQNKAAIQQLKREAFEGQKTIDQLTRYLSAAKQAVAAAVRTQKAVETKRSELEAAQARFTALGVSLAAEQDFVAMVGNQGFLGAIFEEVLQDISTDANEILGRVPNTSTVTIEFKTESVTQKGAVKRSIVPVVSVGGNIGPFDAVLSGGMKTMVMLAVDLAVSKVIARRAGVQPGWLILDEPFDGADSESREAMLELLAKESAGRLILVVDHSVDSKGLFAKTIEVSMVGGVTTIA
jgi:DNA repair exonuclease SbcCD ATPase subunit